MTVTRSTVPDATGKFIPGDSSQLDTLENCVMSDSHWGPQRLVQVIRPPTGGSLGISIVGGKVNKINWIYCLQK